MRDMVSEEVGNLGEIYNTSSMALAWSLGSPISSAVFGVNRFTHFKEESTHLIEIGRKHMGL